MKNNVLQKPDYLFEVSWEVCNKVGGIHTVVSTKSIAMAREVKNHIFVGPDILHDEHNVEFTEDSQLYRAWKSKLLQEAGLRVRVGRWNIKDNPIAILIDYTSFIVQKDKIFSNFWETYKLDSISGQWDYVEPAMFGYAAGKVIENFLNFNLSSKTKVAALFHEWMTGAGVLYLKANTPQVGTIFTTHATVLGRSIAGHGEALYDNMETYNADLKAREFGVVAKQSLEKCAAQTADCFTTVSDITAKECQYFLGKSVNVVTPNGFDSDFVPAENDFEPARKRARKALLNVVQALLAGEKVDNSAMLVATSGRYEFKNKGLDVFLEALGQLNRDANLQRPVYAFVLVPSGHHGAREDVQHNLQNLAEAKSLGDKYTTHYLTEPQYDVILKEAHKEGLLNRAEDKVKLIFCPSYLNGADGIFNLNYYDLLIGFDATVFPSYYEPWGYTPMESVAFRVPTITTNLAGFGLRVNSAIPQHHDAVDVIERNDQNQHQVVLGIANRLQHLTALPQPSIDLLRQNTKQIAAATLWNELVHYYWEAIDIALSKVGERIKDVLQQEVEDVVPLVDKSKVQPVWNRVMVQRSIPEKLQRLEALSKNLWWSWNQDAVELFVSLDKDLWIKSDYNPIALLDKIPYQRYRELEKDTAFLRKLDDIYGRFTVYMEQKSLRMLTHLGNADYGKPMPAPSSAGDYKIAYFSMEYGLHTSLKIYSGGLGILAGDYLKEASDKNVPMVGVGLLYRYGYFTQKLSANGAQEAQYDEQDFMKIPAQPVRDADGMWQTIAIAMPGRNVYARIWRADVGRTELYLLDTDFEENLPEDRPITHQLYGGNWENRLKQELILGTGGIRALRKLGIEADVYHCNEGHAAFIGLERVREYVQNNNLSFTEALEVTRASSLFTTHTPVPAGHDAFDEGMLRTYISHYPARLKTTWEELIKLGKINANDPNEKFSMSNLACNCSQEVNGVSWLHGEVSRDILKGLWPGYYPEELHIGYVTNGVHYETWTSGLWKDVHEKVFGNEFPTHHYDKSCFDKIYEVPDEQIWEIRNKLRGKLTKEIRHRFSNSKTLNYHTPRHLVEIKEKLRDDILTIGFARRFATYKRAHLLFKNLDRLNTLVNNPKMPVQFVFAGKAHPADKAGQDLIRMIVEISKRPEFLGKIVFLQNYDIRIARKMTQGVDVWMNTPTRPLEASGTSGEKAVMNGVMNLSVLDGWWVEGYQKGAGWALPMERAYDDNNFQDELDAETLYSLIENEIAPTFYDRDKNGLPNAWIDMIKNTIAKVASNFTTNRMLQDYEDRFYSKLSQRHLALSKNNFQTAKEIAEWKRKVSRLWDSIEVLSVQHFNESREQIVLGKDYEISVQLDIDSLDSSDVGVELVLAETENDKMKIRKKVPFTCTSQKGTVATYSGIHTPEQPGIYFSGIRLFANNEMLPHRQDFALVRWI
ncbi:hypothetical protein FACS1894156_2610 [Bacteroidia bacterium]|nr:hypothetical protein FACS1894156_2610 [Bacteroidia bacterium]